MTKEPSTDLAVNCPNCQTKVRWNKASTYRPFCSDRCQKIDLGAWADESYAIPTEPGEQWSSQDTEITSRDNADFLQ